MRDVTVIIVSWNTREILRRCLHSIYDQTKSVQFDVIVVDNGSTDGSAEMVRSEFPRVILVCNAENRGFAAANNEGIRRARSRYILLINSDTIVLSAAIDKTVAFADANPRAALVGCRILNADGTWQPSCYLFPSVLNLFLLAFGLSKLCPRNRFFGRERMVWWQGRSQRRVDMIKGCFMLARQQAIEQVGLMDEEFFLYAEDADWCYRFAEAGWQIIFTPEAEIVHISEASSSLNADQRMLRLHRGILRFLRKHRGPVHELASRLVLSLFYALRIPYWVLLNVMPNNRSGNKPGKIAVYAANLLRLWATDIHA